MFQTPPRSRSGNAVFDLEGITEPEEIRIRSGVGLKPLPIPKVVPYCIRISARKPTGQILGIDGELTCTSDIIEVCNFLHSKQGLDFVDGGLVVPAEHSIDVCYHPLNVCRAVCRHILADWL